MHKKIGACLFCITAILLCFTGVCRAFAGNGLPGPIGVVSDFLFRPVQSLFSSWRETAEGWMKGITEAEEDRAEKERLKRELSLYQKETRQNAALKQENERLKKLLGIFEEEKEFLPVACRVIANRDGSITGAFKIDKGAKQSIRIDDAVICTDGLVGRISAVYEHSAIVTPYTEAGNSVAVRDVRNQAFGIVEAKEEGMVYTGFSEEKLPMQGDAVETSGQGGIYPAGILVGTVSDVTGQGIFLEPAVSFCELSEVLVLVRK